MPTSPKDQLKFVARATTAPARNYLNNHFEMTKEEVRGLIQQIAELDHSGQSESTRELSNVVAETALFQSRMISDTRTEIDDLRTEVRQLTTLIDRLVGAMNSRDRHPDDVESAASSSDPA
jgi:hypothetical protein